MPMIDYERPELLPTVIFDHIPELDPNPIETRHGRLIPGPDFSRFEFENLATLTYTLPFTPIPTVTQLSRITINAEMGCWELAVYQDPVRARYGRMAIRGLSNTASSAHRTMYKVFYGADSLPNGPNDFLDHLCENKACCYPRHLERTTVKVNTIRGAERPVLGQLALSAEV